MLAHNIKDWFLRSNNADRCIQIKPPPIESLLLIISLHPLNTTRTVMIEYQSAFFHLQSVLRVIQLILLVCSSLIFFPLCQWFSSSITPKIKSFYLLPDKEVHYFAALSILSKQWNAECFYKLWQMMLRSEYTASISPTQQEAADDLTHS